MILLWLACTADPKTESTPDVEATPAFASLELPELGYTQTPVYLNSGQSTGERFTWDFGDGQSGEGAAVEHSYSSPGRYTLRLTAESGGQRDIADGELTVVNTPLSTAPSAGNKLLWAEERLYAAMTDANEVVVVEDMAVVQRFSVCAEPVSLATRDGVLAVACRLDRVQTWSMTTGTLLEESSFPWGSRPLGLAYDAVGRLWVSGANALWRLEGGPEKVVESPDLRALAAGPLGVYAPRFRSAGASGELLHYDDVGLSFSLPPDPGPDSDTDARGLPNYLTSVVLSPDGQSLVVAGLKANMDRGLVRDGLAMRNDAVSRSLLRSLDPETGEQKGRAIFDNRDMVGAVTFTPTGDRLLVAHLGAKVVDILDPWQLTRIGGWQDVGVGLDGIATDGHTAWVLASWDRKLIAYDLDAGNAQVELGRLDLLATEPLPAEVLAGGRLFHAAGDPRMSLDAYLSCASCHLDGDSDHRTWDFTDRGEGLRNTLPLYAMPTEGPFHWSANFDELQDFENDIRLHQLGTGFLAEADWAECSDTLGPSKAGRSAELDALVAYLDHLRGQVPRSPYRNIDGSPTADAVEGGAIFQREGCESCHRSPDYTDAGWSTEDQPILHDVGTLLPTSGGRLGGELTGLRSPGLRGLHASAPYLHDGRAATVEEALAAHGISLAPADQAALVRFLLELE
jgi:PKD domain/Di-haem oxidoreductase, putative peroxidase